MALTDAQKERIRNELTPRIPEIARAAPPERARLVRQALERAGAQPSWEEWDAYAEEVLGEDAAHVRSAAIRR